MFAALNSFLTRAVTGYFLNKSLRFRSSASAYLNRTPAVAGSQTTWTWSGWVKRGTLGSALQQIFGVANGSNDANYLTLFFQSDTLGFTQWNSPTLYRVTTQVFRDPAAWYHIVLVLDTTQATAANRILVYVNGTAITSFSSNLNPAQNATLPINGAVVHQMGRDAFTSGSINFDGEMAEINFVDGQALAPTAFGAYSIYNQWLPIRYAGTYGTNGFYLPFTNTTSTSTLVADSSGNGNNWTPNNISLTAGSTYDSLTDVPTLTSETVANYCVLNPLDHTVNSYATLDNGNLRALGNTAANSGAFAGTIAANSGLYYWESTRVGVAGLAYVGATQPGITAADADTLNAIYRSDGGVRNFGVPAASLSTWNTDGDVIMVALDMTNGAIYYGKNGTWLNSGVPTSGASKTGALYTWTAGTYTFTPIGGGYTTQDGVSVNFGQQPFVYTAPSGFLPLNTFNI